MAQAVERLRLEIAGCRVCADQLAAGARPVVQLGETARILIIGQAPGSRVHQSGVPWDDDSGRRLREWTGIGDADFYDSARVALMPIGFCYPGKGASGDLPPRPECAPLWHDRVLALLPPDRLTLLVGSFAQKRYTPELRALSMTDRVRQGNGADPSTFLLPHPAWRSVGWMRRNPWFAEVVLPPLRAAVRARL